MPSLSEARQDRALRAVQDADARMAAAVRKAIRFTFRRLLGYVFPDSHEASLRAAGEEILDLDEINRLPAIWRNAVDLFILPVVADVYIEASREAAKAFGLGLDSTSVDRADVQQYLREAESRLKEPIANRLLADAWEGMREQLAQGVSLGEAIPAMATRLRQIERISEVRATLIARTEVVGANNGGALTSTRELPAELQPGLKQWVATLDNRTRPDHAEADGQIVGLNEPFIVGGEELDFPGDPSGSAAQTANCRCTFVELDIPDNPDLNEPGRQFVLPLADD